jgi:class 3 adenylate cyclase
MKPTILIVDDDPVSQQVLSDLVVLCGHETVLADSGEAAWEIFQRDPAIQVAFIDWIMPGMDGLSLCSKIKSHSRDRYVYIIMITAKGGKEDIIRGLEAGADDFLAKPVHEGELLGRLRAGERVLDYEQRLKREMQRADDLLFNVLPPSVAQRMKEGDEIIADLFPAASILFLDIADFSQWCHSVPPQAVMEQLGSLFALFDEEIAKYGAEKIESVGDAYLVAAGLPNGKEDHAIILARVALGIRERIANVNRHRLRPWNIRFGIATGPVVAGVIGKNRVGYDVFGDTVNRASRLETAAPAGEILIDEATLERIGAEFQCEAFGDFQLKGLGLQRVWRIAGPSK